MRVLISTAILLLLGINLSAQTPETQPWMTDSSRAIQFGIGDYLGVRAFDTKSLSCKFHLTSSRALRFGVSLSGYSDKSESDRTTITESGGTPSVEHVNSPRHALTVEVLALHLWYIGTGSDVFLFIGAGPLGQYDRNSSSGTYSGLSNSWSLGAGASVGAEWFVHSRISLHSEYQAAGRYTHTTSSSTSVDDYTTPPETITRDVTSNKWSITSQRVLFGFSVYF